MDNGLPILLIIELPVVFLLQRLNHMVGKLIIQLFIFIKENDICIP